MFTDDTLHGGVHQVIGGVKLAVFHRAATEAALESTFGSSLAAGALLGHLSVKLLAPVF